MDPIAFLNSQHTPLRLSLNRSRGALIVPLWFYQEADRLWCASHETSLIVRTIGTGVPCGFDVSTNDMPYRGVRGHGFARCDPRSGAQVLERLIDRYLPDRNNDLARWLLSRAAGEVAIEITPTRLRSWDFSKRMQGLAQ
jgi:nitroimidazol reductase NimA-like FMN-containing flavoprotein (pyridoxamine 5'-phosphate oxidase superfamily)